MDDGWKNILYCEALNNKKLKNKKIKRPCFSLDHGPHYTGETRKMSKEISCQGKHKEFENVTKIQNFPCLTCKFPDSKDTGYCHKLYAPKLGFFRSQFQHEIVTISEIGKDNFQLDRETEGICKSDLSGDPDRSLPLLEMERDRSPANQPREPTRLKDISSHPAVP